MIKRVGPSSRQDVLSKNESDGLSKNGSGELNRKKFVGRNRRLHAKAPQEKPSKILTAERNSKKQNVLSKIKLAKLSKLPPAGLSRIRPVAPNKMRLVSRSKTARVALNRTERVSKLLNGIDSKNPNEILLLARQSKKLNRTPLNELRKVGKLPRKKRHKRAGRAGLETDRRESRRFFLLLTVATVAERAY